MDFKYLVFWGLLLNLANCTIDARDCESENDCFSNEICKDNTCVQQVATNNGIATNNTRKECEKNADCVFGFCQKPEGFCQCPIGEHLCDNKCISDTDPEFCGGCVQCPSDPRGENQCTPQGECSIQCEAPFQPCTEDSCPRLCIGCSSDMNCGREAPVCSDNQCVSCESANDCNRFSQKICEAGSCVQCTEADPTACFGNSCNPATSECTDTRLRSQTDCEPCVSDFECQAGYGCVPMKFAGADLPDGFCLEKATDECQLPFPVRALKTSLSSGQEEAYCPLNESDVTCKSFTDFGKKCERASDCGEEDLSDAQCRPVRGIDRCTYNCNVDKDCPGGSFCANGLYCLQNN